MKIKVEVKTPTLINFVRIKRGDDKGEGICVPIEDLDEDEWAEFQEEWMAEMDNHRRIKITKKANAQ